MAQTRREVLAGGVAVLAASALPSLPALSLPIDSPGNPIPFKPVESFYGPWVTALRAHITFHADGTETVVWFDDEGRPL